MRLPPILYPAGRAELLSGLERLLSALRAESLHWLQLVFPLVRAHCAGKCVGICRSLQAHRHNDFLEVRASFFFGHQARGTRCVVRPVDAQVIVVINAEARSIRLVVSAVRFGCSDWRHRSPPCFGLYSRRRARTESTSERGMIILPQSATGFTRPAYICR